MWYNNNAWIAENKGIIEWRKHIFYFPPTPPLKKQSPFIGVFFVQGEKEYENERRIGSNNKPYG